MRTPAEVDEPLNGPALQPPVGVQPNFVNPNNIHAVMVVIYVLCGSISTFIFWMRAFTKLYIFRRAGWEDYIAFVAWSVYVGYLGASFLLLQTVPGVHQWNVQLKTFFKALRDLNSLGILYGVAVTFLKISLLLQYLQLFAPSRNRSPMVLVTYLMIWSTSIFHLITIFILIFPCNPREELWNPLISGHCFNMLAVNLAASAINCVSDFVILLLPQSVIWTLQIPFRKKVGISSIFLIGLFACIASTLRLYYSIRVIHTRDITHDLVIVGLCTHVEFTLGIICGSLPVSPRFFKFLQPEVLRLFKTCFRMRTIPGKIKSCLFAMKRGKAGNPTNEDVHYLGEMYSLNWTERRGDTANSVADVTLRSMAQSAESSAAGLNSVERGPEKNRIRKTVKIETIEEFRNGPNAEVETAEPFRVVEVSHTRRSRRDYD